MMLEGGIFYFILFYLRKSLSMWSNRNVHSRSHLSHRPGSWPGAGAWAAVLSQAPGSVLGLPTDPAGQRAGLRADRHQTTHWALSPQHSSQGPRPTRKKWNNNLFCASNSQARAATYPRVRKTFWTEVISEIVFGDKSKLP